MIPDKAWAEGEATTLDEATVCTLERLAEAGVGEEVRRRHAAYYLALAERAAIWRSGTEWQRGFDRLESEYDNLRAAADWALACSDAGFAIRLATALRF